MKICIAQHYTSNLSYGSFSEDINRRYAENNGYDYYVEKDDEKIRRTLSLDENGWKSDIILHPTWYKPSLILEVFESLSPDYVLFLDADAIVSDSDKRIEEYINEDYNFIGPDDTSEHSVLCAGVFLIKNCDWSIRFLKKWMGLARALKPTEVKNLSFPESEKDNMTFFSRGLWHDQSVLTYMHSDIKEIRDKIKILPSSVFNSRDYSETDGSFIFHAYAHGLEKYRGLDRVHSMIFNADAQSGYEVEVKKAFYGSIGKQVGEGGAFAERKVIDVTDKIVENFKKNKEKWIDLTVWWYGSSRGLAEEDPALGFEKSLEIHLSIDGEDFISTSHEGRPCWIDFSLGDLKSKIAKVNVEESEKIVENFDVLEDASPKSSYKVEVKKAFYGSVGAQIDEGMPVTERVVADVTDKVIENFKNNEEKRIDFSVVKHGREINDLVIEDPHPGFAKNLEIHVSIDGEDFVLIGHEGQPYLIDFSLGELKSKITNENVEEPEKIEEGFNDLEEINLIVYHIFCVGNYLEVVSGQLERLKSSGLYDWCDKLEITCISTDGNFKEIEELIENLDKANLSKFTNNGYEHEPINKVWEYSQKHSGRVLYFHAKGVSNQYKAFESKEPSEWKIKGVNFWRGLMEHFLIDNHKDCLKKLDSYDQCGVTLNGGWWWGNFWWANLSWIRDNPKPTGGDRWWYEAWINLARESPKAYQYYHFDWHGYYTYLPLELITNPKSSYEVEVKKAFYGSIGEQVDEGRTFAERKVIDVTDKVVDNFKKNEEKRIDLIVSSDLFGEDPAHGYEKSLEIHLSIDGEDFILTQRDGDFCQIAFPLDRSRDLELTRIGPTIVDSTLIEKK